MAIIHRDHCPSCNAASIEKLFAVKDYTASAETFWIWECKNCSLRFTQDVPDRDSIGRYYASENYISHTDTAKGLVNLLYRQIRKKTLKRKRKWVQRETCLSSGSLLDFGSGTGYFGHEMQTHNWNIVGLEPEEAARKMAKQLHHIELLEPNYLFEMKEEVFDAITLWHVLEHVHELHPTIDALKKTLKQDGRLFVAVPNYTSADANKYKEYWAAYDVPRHLYHFSPASMMKLAEIHGMEITKFQPMWFDSYYISLVSSRYKTGKTKFLQGMLNGWRSNIKARGNNKRCSSIVYVMRKK
jgi:2-polyprenyl-3-methyl-5-hydroxy-6-metoxy-1,4-benzoquinol methylase